MASVAYSATGSLSQSEDLAQETFLAAWKDLRALREPQRLAAWLCGIARRMVAGALRRRQRDPAQQAAPLELVAESPAPGAIPVERAISREEEAILWRSLEQVPEIYREPLILFYREGRSIEHVAQWLGVSPEAIRQRLSRGRKLLEERLAVFVEGALKHSAPGRSFTRAVMGALPMQIASAGATAAKGGATVKAAGWLAAVNACAGPLAALVTNYLGYRMDMAGARSDQQRRVVQRYYRLLTGCIVVPVALPRADWCSAAFRSACSSTPVSGWASGRWAGWSWACPRSGPAPSAGRPPWEPLPLPISLPKAVPRWPSTPTTPWPMPISATAPSFDSRTRC